MAFLVPLILAALAVFLGSATDALIKAAALGLPILTVVLWRYCLGTVVAAALFVISKERWPGGGAVRFHCLRGTVQLGAGLCFFWALAQLGLAEVTVLGFTAALYIAPLAFLLMGEAMTRISVGAALVGFAGAAFAVSGLPSGPAEGARVAGILAALLAAGFYALGVVMLRMRAGREGPLTMVLFSNAVPAIGMLTIAGAAWVTGWGKDVFVMPPPGAILPLGAIGTMGVLTWWLYTLAFARAPAARIAPLEYSSLIWSAILGFVFFAEVPGWRLYAGAVLIVGACLAVALEGRFAARRAARLPAADVLE